MARITLFILLFGIMHLQSVNSFSGDYSLNFESTSNKEVFEKADSNAEVKLDENQQQTIKIRGRVVDEQNEPVIGANIVEMKTTNGTVTDIDGNFSLTVNKNALILISYIGMESRTVQASEDFLEIVLQTASIEMAEVMVVAYGTTDRRTYTGSVSTMNSQDILKNKSNNVLSALQGVVPGIQLENKSRAGGQSTTEIVIRGASSINASIRPLYIIDGVPNDDMSHLNPNDIESISVLKDAAAISLYGARATNGVILITSKQGIRKGDKAIVSYLGQFGISSRTGQDYEKVSPQEHFELTWEVLRNGAVDDSGLLTAGGKSYTSPEEYATNELLRTFGYNPFGVNNPVGLDGRLVQNAKLLWWEDYNKELLKTGNRNEHSFSISGATDRIKYYLSTGYLDQRTIEPGNPGFSRFSNRLNFSYDINDKITVGANIGVTHSSTKTTSIDNGYANFTTYARLTPGLYPIHKRDVNGNFVYDEDGNKVLDFGNGPADIINSRRPDVTSSGPSSGINPFGTLDLNKSTNKGTYFFTNYYFDYDILDNLNFRASYSSNTSSAKSSTYRNRTIGSGVNTNGALDVMTSQYSNWTANSIVTYNQKIDEIHSFKLMGGFEINENSSSTVNAAVRNFAFEGMDELGNGAEIVMPGTGAGMSYKQRLIGYFSRLEYNYSSKYYLLGNIRRDGSSNFHPDTRWGNFWSVGGGWLISEEDFLKNANWISLLKLRGSYGTSGNIGSHDYRAYYKSGYSYLGASGVYISSMPNKNLKWEVNKQFNIGLDANLFKNRIRLTLDLYNRVTDDLFYNVPLSPSIGFNQVLRNIGSLSNKGIEFSITTQNIANKHFNWTTNFNIAHNKNKILSLNQDEFITGLRIYKVGESTTEFFIADYAGVNPENGKPRWYLDEVDENTGEKTGKLVTTENFRELTYKSVKLADGTNKVFRDLGRKPMGNYTPNITGGLSNSFRYKDFDFSFLFSYSLGSKILMMDYVAMTSSTGGVFHKDMLQRWQKPGDVTSIPKLTSYKKDNFTGSRSYISTFYMRSGDFFKLKNITLGYSLPKTALDFFKISSARLFLQADNVCYWSKEKGFDPEQVSMGMVDTLYPSLSTYSIGVKIDF